MKKFLILSVLLVLLTLSAVSAAENVTADSDVLSEVDNDELKVLDDEDSLSDSENQTVSSEITSSDVVGYSSFETDISARLTSEGKPLSSKTVKISVADKSYSRTTDSNGKIVLSLDLKKGTYNALFTFEGDGNISSANFTSKITIKDAIKTKLKVGDKDINYRQGSKCLFYVKLTTDKGKAIKNQLVTIKVAGKTYNVKTDKYGYAKVYLNLKKGTYKVKFSFKKSSPYLASSGSVKIKSKPKMAKGNGYWLWPAHMKSINLKSLAKRGTKHIFLHSYAISVHGKSSVISFIKKAHRHKIKVHLWMQVAYDGKTWVSLVDGKGKLKYSFMNKKIREAKRLAKVKGVDGVHFDYMRYGGTAHKHPNAKESINWFVKKASKTIRSVKPNCMVSIAIMPEPDMMLYYYGQDIPTISKYVDSLLPMAYKGNYHQKSSWIGKVTKKFVSQSNGAQIWTGLQSYHSDNNAKRLSQKALLKDAKSAMKGGAKGVILFRIGISCNFNFKKV